MTSTPVAVLATSVWASFPLALRHSHSAAVGTVAPLRGVAKPKVLKPLTEHGLGAASEAGVTIDLGTTWVSGVTGRRGLQGSQSAGDDLGLRGPIGLGTTWVRGRPRHGDALGGRGQVRAGTSSLRGRDRPGDDLGRGRDRPGALTGRTTENSLHNLSKKSR